MKFKKLLTMLTAAAIAGGQLISAVPVHASYSFNDEKLSYVQRQDGDAVDTEVVNFLAVEQQYYPKGIILSWNNPDDLAVEDIAIFRNGEEIEEDAEWDYTAGGFNRIGVEKVGAEDIYTLQIVKDGKKYKYEAIYSPVSSSSGNWSFALRDGWASDTEPTSKYSNSAAFISSDCGYDDDYCLKIMSNCFQKNYVDNEDRNDNQNVSNNRLLTATFNFPMELTIENGVEYQVRYMVKTKSAWGLYLYAGNRSNNGWDGESGNTGIARNSGWTQKIKTFTHDGKNNSLEFSIPRACDGIWIDNFQIGIYDADTDTFDVLYEDDFAPEIVPIEPLNFFGSTGKEGVWAVSWQNPEADTLEAIELYEVTEEDEIFVSDDFNLNPNTKQSYEFADATGVKLVKGVFRYTTGEVIELFATKETYSLWGDTIPNWNFGLNTQQTFRYVPGMFVVDQSMSHTDDGSASAKFMINQPSTIAGTFASFMYKDIELEGGKTYRLSLWARSIGTTSDVKANVGFSGAFIGGVSSLASSSGQYEWKQYTLYFTTSDDTETVSQSFGFNIDPGTTGFWMDDIEIYEVDAETKEPINNKNLAVNGNISQYDKPTGTPSKLKATGGDRSVTLSWENDTGYSFVYLYKVVDDEYQYLGAIPAARNSVTLTNLERETEYTYAIAPAAYFGVTGKKIEATAKTLLLEVEMSEPELEGGALSVGKNTIAMTVKNNTSSDDIPVEMLVGIYKDDVLQEVKSDKALLEMTAADGPSETLRASFNIGDDGDYSVRVMVIDSRSALNSWFDMYTFE